MLRPRTSKYYLLRQLHLYEFYSDFNALFKYLFRIKLSTIIRRVHRNRSKTRRDAAVEVNNILWYVVLALFGVIGAQG